MIASFDDLVPFTGLHGPGFHLNSGDYLHLVDWDETPGDIGPYACIWHFDPWGVRTLYIDPESAAPVVLAFHDFDRVVGAGIDFDWPGPWHLRVRMIADDGATLRMDVRLEETRATRFLRRVSHDMGHDHYPSHLFQRLSDAMVRRLLTHGGGSIGETETGRTFDFSQVDRLMLVKHASIEWIGQKRELADKPIVPVSFGNVPAATRPYLYLGTAMLEHGPEMDQVREVEARHAA